jgi:hypothetical protein
LPKFLPRHPSPPILRETHVSLSYEKRRSK